MSIKNFIPTVWAENLLETKEKVHVVARLANREYEGDIRNFGDTVKVVQIGDITVSDYDGDSDISYEDLNDASSLLTIDKQKYFAFQVDDVDAAQSKPGIMEKAMKKAAYGLRDNQDSYLLGLYAQAGMSVNSDASPADVTSLNVDEQLLEVAEEMDVNNVPREGRVGIVPPWFHNKCVLAGLTAKTEKDVLFDNGYIDRILGFDLFLSNNVSIGTPATGAQTRMIFGIEGESFALAEQILNVEALRLEKRFKDAIRGLHVYGGKIFRPDLTCVLYADKTAES